MSYEIDEVNNFTAGVNLATNSLRILDSVVPNVVIDIGTIIEQANLFKETMNSGASKTMAWATAVSVAVNIVISIIKKYREEQENAAREAAQSAEEYKNNISGIKEYGNEVAELKSKLKSLNLTRDEEIESKQRLQAIQNELIEKYGLEAEQIDLVTGSIYEQKKSIEELQKTEALNWMNKHGKDYNDYKDEFENPQEYNIIGGWAANYDLSDDKDVKKFNEELSKIAGVSGGLKRTNDERGYELNIKVNVDGKDAENAFIDIQNAVQNVDNEEIFQSLEAELQNTSNKYFDEYWENRRDTWEKGSYFQSIIDGTAEASKTLSETINDTISESQISIDGLASSLSELASAYETVANGGSLSADNLKELIEKYPLLAEYINETGDVSLASGKKIKEAYEEERKALIDKLNAEKAEHSKKLGETSEIMWSKLNSGEDYSEEQKAVMELNDRISEINAQLTVYESELGEIENSNLAQKIDEQAAALSNLSSAYKTVTDGGSLSAESLKSLTAEFPQLQQYIAETGDLTFSNGEVIKQAYQDEYDEMIKNLEAEKERLETLGNEPQKLQEINAELQIYKACLADINEAPSFTDISGELKSLANAYRDLSDSKQLDVDTMISMIDKYPEVASAIAKEGSLTKDQADIFKTLFEAKKNDYILTQQKAADNLKASLAETEGVIANISAQIEAYKKLDLIMGAIAATGLTLAMNTNKEQAATIKKEIEKVEARINAVPKIGVDTYGKSDSTSSEITSGGGNKDTSNKALAEELRQLEQKKSLGKLTAKQEYDELVRINKKYKKNADEKMDMEKRLYNAKKAWQDDIEASRKAKLQAAYDDIDHKKAMGQMTTAQELDQLEKIRKTYKLNAEEKKELDEKIYALKKQQAEELEQANSQKLQEEYKNIENLKSLGKMTAKEELAQLEKIRKKNKMNAEERMELEIKIYNLKKEVKEDEIDSLNDLAGAVTEALKNKYEEQQKLEEEYINESIKSWQTWEDETVAAIQGQIDALDELAEADDREAKRQEYENKRQQLEMQLAYEKDDYNRKSIERELAKLDTDEAKRLAELQREDQKKSLQQEIENVKKESEQQQQQLQKSLEENNKKYDELTSPENLKAQTAQMLMNSSQEEIVNFIKGYAPNYDLAGQTIGESLYNGFKSKVGDIEKYIEGITSKVTSYQSKLAKTANTAADKFWSTRSSYQMQISASKAPAPVSVNQTVNFNQPVTTPVQTKRQLNTVSQALAQQIVNGG